MWRGDMPFRRETLDEYATRNLGELPPRLHALVMWTSDTRNPAIDKRGKLAAEDELTKLNPAMHELEWVEAWLGWCADRKRMREAA